MDIFSTRELATAFWTGIILVAVGMAIVTNKKARKSFIEVLKCFFGRKIRMLWEIYFLYIGIITFLFSRLPIWESIYLKDIIIWTLFSGLTICINAVAGEADEKYILKVLKDNIRFTMVTELLLSTFTFSFWVELIIIPITTVIVLFDTVAEHKSDAIAVHKLLQDVMAFAGLCVILQTVRVGILEYRELNVINTLVSFFIPIVYLLLVTPLEYAFELYSKYEMLFIQMHFKEPSDKMVQRKRHLKVIKVCGLAVKRIILPKKKTARPDLYVEWSNLTLACEVCNRTYKKDYYDPQNPLVNPYVDDPNDFFLFLGTIISTKNNNSRGFATENILGLNRSDLVVRRNERLQSISKLLFSWEQATSPTIKEILANELKKECAPDKEYSAFVKHFLIAKGFPESKLA